MLIMRFTPAARLAPLAVAGLLAAALPAQAHEQIYGAPLLGSSETPPAITPGNGSVTLTLDLDLLTLRVQASFSDLTGTTTAAHIHCCTVEPGTGNAGVASMTPSFTGFPVGVTAGSYDATFDLSLNSSYNAAFITANGGTVSGAFNALVAGLDAGRAYFNVHTTTFPGGEIRGLLAPVPEPETYALLLGGLGLLALATRRRKG
jgi:hypothetical protein